MAAEGVHKSFRHEGNDLHVLKGIDLQIAAGEILCIVGASGAGKSTLLHVLGTLDIPSRGRVVVGGTDLSRMSGRQLAAFRNKTIGFVFQFHHLLPEFTALENVMMPGLIQGLARGQIAPRAHKILEQVGLSHRLTHRPGELSGGEQQRVALARALVLEPKLLLADEPTGNLDSGTSKAIHDLFFELNGRLGTTIVIVTHSPSLAEKMPRVVSMKDGRVDEDIRR
ncbi:MAG: ABC transporter ATP-binding protein [Deltaproteobacteria bacterium]|nr:ABC transporter ATP-binding protein [Deltaproteobacteria bacterium]